MAKKLFLIPVDPESDFGKSLESFLQENQRLENVLCVDVSRDGVMLSSKNQSISLLPPIWAFSSDSSDSSDPSHWQDSEKQNQIKNIDELERRYKYRGLYGPDA